MKTTLQTVTEIVTHQLCIIEPLHPTDDLYKDHGADSLDTVEVQMAIEYAFKMEILDEDSEKWRTINDIVTYIDNRITQQAQLP